VTLKPRAPHLLAAGLLAGALALPGGVGSQDALPSGGLLRTPFGAALTARLAKDGFDRARVTALLEDRRAQVLESTIKNAIVYREAPGSYDFFLKEERLAKARAYLQQNRALLEQGAARSGVPAEIATAILMIESDFGSYRKINPVADVFLTFLWAAQPENFETVRAIIQKRLPDVPPEKIREKLASKSKWAYEQLGYLLKIGERERIDLLDLYGSWAGAFGMPQFIPSSYWGYGADGDGDGKVDLFNPADAVASIGRYLRSMGWKNDLTPEQQKAVIKRYNNSDLYAAAVLEVASRLRTTP
jgi:membrane-bound lytic murein transglycosylase B